MQRFDENGNFVNLPKVEEVEEPQSNLSYFTSNCAVAYTVVENKKNESEPKS